MRTNILVSGGLILAVSVLLFNSGIVAAIFGLTLGALNVLIAILTPKTNGIAIPANPQGHLKLLIGKGVIRTSIYAVAFSEKTLVLRKLGSANLTVATALLLAILGAFLAGPFGIIAGGITAFSIQEFVTQRRRDQIKTENILDDLGRGDIEFPYEELEQIQLLRNRIQLYLKDRIVRIAISRKYSQIIGPILEKIIPARIKPGAVPSEKAP